MCPSLTGTRSNLGTAGEVIPPSTEETRAYILIRPQMPASVDGVPETITVGLQPHRDKPEDKDHAAENPEQKEQT